jgi:hypothetical protein
MWREQGHRLREDVVQVILIPSSVYLVDRSPCVSFFLPSRGKAQGYAIVFLLENQERATLCQKYQFAASSDT